MKIWLQYIEYFKLYSTLGLGTQSDFDSQFVLNLKL